MLNPEIDELRRIASSPLKNPRGARGVPLDEVKSVRDQGAVAALAG